MARTRFGSMYVTNAKCNSYTAFNVILYSVSADIAAQGSNLLLAGFNKLIVNQDLKITRILHDILNNKEDQSRVPTATKKGDFLYFDPRVSEDPSS